MSSTFKDGSYLIVESSINQDPDVKRIDARKAIFRMVIQTLDEVNLNHRLYPKNVVLRALDDCKPMMEKRNFYGELDHPLVTGQDEYDNMRQTVVLLKETSHIITDYEVNGNKVVAQVETTDTSRGHDLLGLIKGGSAVGMSMRGFAEIERNPNYYEVKEPLTIISYDAVSNPSHKSALINFNEVVFENKFIHEDAVRFGSDVVCVGNQCFLANYFDKLVEKKIIKFLKKWV